MTTAIATNVTPTPIQLWALAYLLRANWRDAVVTRSSFETNITAAFSTAEQRFGLRVTPFRTSTVLLSASGKAEVQKLRLFMQRAGQSRFLFPLYSDVTLATTALTATATTITCDTTNRRFAVGRRVAVCANSPDAAPTFETAVISGVTSTTLTLSAGLTNNYDIHATILPLMESNLVLNSSGGVVTSQYAHATFTAIEAANGLQLANIVAVGSTPAGYPTYGAVPIFDTEPNYAEETTFNVTRSGRMTDSGIDSIPAVYGDRAAFGFKASYPTYDRASLWKLLTFFESRGGMLLSFFGISPTVEFTATAVAVDGSTITVQANTLEYDWAYTGYIAVRQVDGTVDVRKVAMVVRVGSSDTITFDSAITGLTLGNVQRVHHAFHARFDQDELTESWTNNVVQNTTLSIKELIEEKDVTIADLVKVISSPLRTVWIPGICEGVVYMRRAWRCSTNLPYGFTEDNPYLLAVWLTLEDAAEIDDRAFFFDDTDCLFINWAEDPIPVAGITPTPVARSLDDIARYDDTCAECLDNPPPPPDDPVPCPDCPIPEGMTWDDGIWPKGDLVENYNLALNLTIRRWEGNTTGSGAPDSVVTGTQNITMGAIGGTPSCHWIDYVFGDGPEWNYYPFPIHHIHKGTEEPCEWYIKLQVTGSCAAVDMFAVKGVGGTPVGSYTSTESGERICDTLDGKSIGITINSAVVS